MASAVLLLIAAAAAPAFAQTKSPGAAPSASAPASATAKDTPAPPMAVAVDANFQIGLGDNLVIELIGRKDFDSAVQVSGEGTILVPLVGKIAALNQTTDQLAQVIEDALKKGQYYADPMVRVSVTGVASRYVTVLGDVSTPGLLPLDRTYHLSDVLAKTGAHFSEGSGTVIITHPNGEQAHFNFAEIATGAASGDPLILPADKIYVPPVAQEVIYVSGQVRSPGSFPLTKNMTIRDAIARGGGLTEMGSDRKLKLFRKDSLVKDVKLDTQLQAGDILQIGERLF